jgi:hypothetical protein
MVHAREKKIKLRISKLNPTKMDKEFSKLSKIINSSPHRVWMVPRSRLPEDDLLGFKKLKLLTGHINAEKETTMRPASGGSSISSLLIHVGSFSILQSVFQFDPQSRIQFNEGIFKKERNFLY